MYRKEKSNMYQVKNLPEGWKSYKYTVIRDCNNGINSDWQGFWLYYGGYDDLAAAHREASEISNGVLVETKDIEDTSPEELTLKGELEKLCQNMASHVKHLRDETYHPYDKEEQFTYKLRSIINKYF